MPVNSNKPHLWKSDTLESIDFYNDWFLRFAPATFREQRVIKTREAADALIITTNLRSLTPQLLKENPGILPMLRMTAAPPLARDRLVGLAYTTKNLVSSMEGSDTKPPRIPARMDDNELNSHLERIVDVLTEVADRDLFPWLEESHVDPSDEELIRSASVVADRLCGAAADPIIRNAQERRQLNSLGSFLQAQGYKEVNPGSIGYLQAMPLGTYTFRYNIAVGTDDNSVNIPVDCIISKHTRKPHELPILIEAKSAGDATNTNKRRKEEAQKFNQLKQKLGERVSFILFLCGYFEPGYLGYEASEGIDWIWEHRITDLLYYLDEQEENDKSNLVKEELATYASEFLTLESERLRRQKEVDASKSSLERNQLGQFSTPFSLASQISRYAFTLFNSNATLHILEPACGSGVFISSSIRQKKSDVSYTCIEIDDSYANICKELFIDYSVEVLNNDYFSFLSSLRASDKYELLLTNPPYVRHHHIESGRKRQFQEWVHKTLGIRVSGLSGLYIYYVLLSDQVLIDGAIASWLIPSEFLYTNYGKALREYLIEKVSLIRIHKFEAEDVQFDDALVSSCVVTYRKESPKPGLTFDATAGTYDNPTTIKKVPYGSIRSSDKWNFLDSSVTSSNHGIPLEELFHVTRGLATGNNNFFLLNEEETLAFELDNSFLIPVLPGPREIQSSIIKSDSTGTPAVENKRYLLSVTQPPNEIEKRYPNTYEYLQEGVRRGIHKGYLCQSRKVWYFQEKRLPPLFVATYMGRNGSEERAPIRFILNRSNAVATNVYICLYPRTELRRLLKGNNLREEELLQALNSIPRASIESAGRSYGGGLQKIEPKELRSVRIENLPNWLTERRVEQIEMFDRQ